MPQLKIVDHLPPFYNIPSYPFQDQQYYRINDIINSFFIKCSTSSPSKLLGKGFFGNAHVIPNKKEANKLGIDIEKGPETIIDLTAVFFFVMNVTNEDKLTQTKLFDHFITTQHRPFETTQQIPEEPSLVSSLGNDEFEFFDEDEEEDPDSDFSNKTDQIQTQDHFQRSSNEEMCDDNRPLDDDFQINNFLGSEHPGTPVFEPATQENQTTTCIGSQLLTNGVRTESILIDQQMVPIDFLQGFHTFSPNYQVYNRNDGHPFLNPDFNSSYPTYSRIDTDQIISKEIEGIALHHFRCAHCLRDANVYFTGGYDGCRMAGSQYSKNSKTRCIMDVECFEYLLKAQNHDIYAWFDCLLKTKEGIKKVKTILQESKDNNLKKLLQDEPKQRNVDDLLYWKDNNLVSFKVMNNLRKEGRLMKEIPNQNTLQKRKKEVDIELESMMKIMAPSSEYIGFLTDLSVAIEQILKLYICLGGRQLPRTVYFKLCVDGREVNGKKQVAIVLVPLNLRDKFPTQSVSSVFYIGLFIGAETSESLTKTVGTLSESLKEISSKQFEGSNIKIIYVSDMHNVGMTFEYEVCPFCKTDRVLKYTCDRRTCISGCLPFQPNDIFMCLLHIKQRMVENTIAYCASHSENKDIILENLRKLPGMELFDWRELKRRYSDFGNPTTENRATVKCSMITGDRCDMILNNYEIIFNGISMESKAKYLKLFSLLKDIISICELKQETDCNEETITDDHIKKLESLIVQFLVQSINLWTIGVKSHYFHYIIHVPEMMKRLLNMGLSLSAISNQGFERSHLFHHSVFNRALNNGGGRVRTHPTKQLLLWQWRKVYWAIALHKREGSTYWEDKRLKAEYVWKKTQEKKQRRKELCLNNKEVSNTGVLDLENSIELAIQEQTHPSSQRNNSTQDTPETPKKRVKKAQSERFAKKKKL